MGTSYDGRRMVKIGHEGSSRGSCLVGRALQLQQLKAVCATIGPEDGPWQVEQLQAACTSSDGAALTWYGTLAPVASSNVRTISSTVVPLPVPGITESRHNQDLVCAPATHGVDHCTALCGL